MSDLQMWNPYIRAMPSSTDFLHFKFCLVFQSWAPTEMPLILTTLRSTHQHREQQADHSGVHNLSQEQQVDDSGMKVAESDVTSQRSKACENNALY
jgi:hypothetical protein